MATSANVPQDPTPTAGRIALTSGLSWLAVFLVVFSALRALQPPDPVPASAPTSDFSAERAMAHVRAIAARPHPIGSPANRIVREYLVAQLSGMGMQPQVFSAIGLNVSGSSVAAGQTENIVSRLPGAANSRAMMLVAHYDSVDRAPGAGDDSAGVAAILETVRALRAGPPLKNDLIVLFTDGEEAGLLGSEAFASSHPWVKDVGLIMNFEGRGNRGPSLLFETSPGNAALIRSVAHSAARPNGSSLSYELYKLLPNDTDFTSFRRAAIPGLNFAFGAGFDAYHSRLDTADNLNTASLQHHGSYALALTRHFGQLDLVKLPTNEGDAIFFDWFGGNLVFYSQRWVLPGEALATILLLAAVALALRRGDVRIRKLLAALLPVAGFPVLVTGVIAVIWLVVSWPLGGRLLATDAPANSLLLAGLALCGVLVATCFFHGIRRAFTTYELFAAALVLLCCLSWVLALIFPLCSYLLFWPVFFCSIGLLVSELRKAPSTPAALIVASLPGMAAALLLFAPVVYLVYIFLMLNLISVAVAGLFISLASLLSLPYMNLLVPRGRPTPVLAALLTVAVALLIAGATLSGHSAEHPGHDTVFYSLNADDHTAAWVSSDESLDRWSSQFFPTGSREHRPAPQYSGGGTRPLFTAPAPVQEIAAPVATIKSDEKDGDLHRLHLSIKSPRSAAAIYLRFPKEIRGLSADIEGRSKSIGESPNPLRINLFGMADKEIDLKITLKAPSGISFWLMDQSVGMPVSANPRPGDLMPWYGSDVTIVLRQYKF